ncbi:MAG: exopolysaccharide biosynthesis protein [bacterium]
MNRDATHSSPIDLALDHCVEHARGGGIQLAEVIDRIGSNSFCFVAFLLAVPFVQPLPLGPLTMACGVTFVALGWQMVLGRPHPQLPKSAGQLRIHGTLWLAALGFSQRLLKFCRFFTRERLQFWVEGERGHRLVGWLILIGGALLAIPAASLPLNNFFPALMIIFACLGWLERDGVMILVSIAWGAITVIYFVLVIMALLLFGKHLIGWLQFA